MTDSVLLNRQCKDQLRKWIGRRTKFSTLYRLTRDGVDAAVFHANCNGKGANITVAKLPAGNIIGGYLHLTSCSKHTIFDLILKDTHLYLGCQQADIVVTPQLSCLVWYLEEASIL